MAQNVLSLEVPETLNACQMKVQDTSIYNTAPTCLDLQVTPPGFRRAVDISASQTINPGFSLNLTACDLGLQTSGCGTTYADLPDGLYVIKYSIAPADYVYVEYNHLRITKALQQVNDILCDLDIAACEPPEKVKAKLMELNLIRMYLLAAKAKVEWCLTPEAGLEIFAYACKLLRKMECKSC